MAMPIDISYQQQPQQQQQQHNHHAQLFRRESFAHSQGMGGISWGGISVGSWIRDEVMANSNVQNQLFLGPHGQNSGSSFHNMNNDDPQAIHSSSYIPKLEANFCRDYNCCGRILPTLHDLLQHYEESHIAMSPQREPVSMARPTQMLEAVSTNEVFLSPHSSTPASPMIMEEDDDEMCIDDPARHLYVMEQGENRPFKCPVNGCDKTYKNQNGLKYHRLHGHQNQTLHLNDDGTYSVVDPLSNMPYPNGVDLEKDKPYRCDICGKRYKNLNGLKYHRAHSNH